MALWLAKLRVPFRIIEKNSGPGQTSRAMAVHARTLEFYRQIGIADEVVRRGIKAERMRLHEGGGDVSVLNFGDFGKGLSPYPFILTFPQDEHERLLGERLGAMGVRVEWNTELSGFTDVGNHVEATLKSGGKEEKCAAKFLCGCDGAHSAVRDGMKLKFSGGIYEQMFFVADVAADGAPANGDINFFLGPHQLCLTFPIRTTGMVRLIGILPREVAARRNVVFDDIREQFEKALSLRVHQVNWFSTYHVHHRVAEHFRRGRVFLCGDAGHVHSPAGGQGMNTGIGDAVNLSWKLAAVLARKAEDALIDTYETERIAFAHSLVSTTDRLFRAVVQESLAGEVVRTILFPRVIPFLMGFSPIRRFQFRLISQTRINYRHSRLSEGNAGVVRGGDRLPWVETNDGGNFAPLTSLDWQIHVYGKAGEALRRAASEANLALHEFAWNAPAEHADLERDALYLVRPDGYIAFANSRQDVEKLRQFLSRFKIAPFHAMPSANN